jgi:rhomboid family GlyGly-CTERM serine protease
VIRVFKRLSIDYALMYICCICVMFISNEYRSIIMYTQNSIDSLEIWRLWTGHVVHTTWYHVGINLTVASILIVFFNKYIDRTLSLMTVIVIMPCITLGLYCFDPDIKAYMGFSGVIQAWISFLLVRSMHESPAINIVLLILQWLRIVYEQTPFFDVNYLISVLDYPVAVNAHFYGALSGLISGIIVAYSKYLYSSNQDDKSVDL